MVYYNYLFNYAVVFCLSFSLRLVAWYGDLMQVVSQYNGASLPDIILPLGNSFKCQDVAFLAYETTILYT